MIEIIKKYISNVSFRVWCKYYFKGKLNRERKICGVIFFEGIINIKDKRNIDI